MNRDAEPATAASPMPALLTDEPEAVLRFLAAALDEGMGCALATLVEIRGGSARALGAQMAVRADGLFCGHVSGGCVEAAVAREAMNAVEAGADRFLHLGEGSPFFDIRLPCGGGIRLAIHVLKEGRAVRQALACLAARRPAALAYDAAARSLEALAAEGRTRWQEGRFLRFYRPRLRVALSGRSIEAMATAGVAAAAGYETVFAEGGADFDADTAAVFLQHDLERELPLLARALEGPAFYIGALGSARTHERRCAALRGLGFGEAALARIRAPVGLFPKARDARSLALSVVAEIAALRGAALES